MFALCWLVFPAVLVALALGVGALVERLADKRIPGTLLVPVGLAGIIVIAQFLVAVSSLARFATPVVTVAGVAGLVLLVRSRRPGRAIDRSALVVAVRAFLGFAPPS